MERGRGRRERNPTSLLKPSTPNFRNFPSELIPDDYANKTLSLQLFISWRETHRSILHNLFNPQTLNKVGKFNYIFFTWLKWTNQKLCLKLRCSWDFFYATLSLFNDKFVYVSNCQYWGRPQNCRYFSFLKVVKFLSWWTGRHCLCLFSSPWGAYWIKNTTYGNSSCEFGHWQGHSGFVTEESAPPLALYVSKM